MKPLSVAIAGFSFGFPHGRAAARRVGMIARGLVENGGRVSVLQMACTEVRGEEMNTRARGMWGQVPYEYTTGTPLISSSFAVRRWQQLHGLAVGLSRICQMRRAAELDVLYLYSSVNTYLSAVVVELCRRLEIPVALELNEWPPALGRKSRLHDAIFVSGILKRVDGVVAISEELAHRAGAARGGSASQTPDVLTVPVLVDPKEWEGNRSETTSGKRAGNISTDKMAYPPRILWCGDVRGYLGAVEFLLDALSRVRSAGSEAVLQVVGACGPVQLRQLSERRQSLGLPDACVEFLGHVSSEQLGSLYAGASALLLPLTRSEKDLARFPTKLAEYLASGTPVVCSEVGEFRNFARDSETAYFCKPEDSDSMAGTILRVLRDPEEARLVGQAGKELCYREFHYSVHGKRLLAFLDAMTRTRRAITLGEKLPRRKIRLSRARGATMISYLGGKTDALEVRL